MFFILRFIKSILVLIMVTASGILYLIAMITDCISYAFKSAAIYIHSLMSRIP